MQMLQMLSMSYGFCSQTVLLTDVFLVCQTSQFNTSFRECIPHCSAVRKISVFSLLLLLLLVLLLSILLP